MGVGDWECLLPFDTDEPEFVRGFEMGRLWAEASRPRSGPITAMIHATNAEMVMRIAEATRRTFEGREIDGTWMEVVLT